MSIENHFGEIRQLPAPLRHLIADRLRSAIVSGLLKPGERLNESQLSKSMKISRPSLREAIRQIESEGLVEVIPNVGPIVRQPPYEELLEISDMTAVLGSLCARYFATNGTDEDVDRLDEAIDDVEAALKRGVVEDIRVAREAYYQVYAKGSGSPLLARYLLQMLALTSSVRGSSLKVPGRPTEAVFEMRRIAEAIRNGDPELAAAANMTFSQHAKMLIIKVMSKKGEGDESLREPKAKAVRPKRVLKCPR
jgi:DNA-binding GntR family transcriptional regulator